MNRAARLAVFALAAAGITACVAHLALVWSRPADSVMLQFASTTGSITAGVLLSIAVLIAWRGADHPPNLALALAIAAIFAGNPLDGLYQEGVLIGLLAPSMTVLFLLGAGFFIRAGQLFPMPLHPADVAASPTLAGRIPLVRRLLSALLRPAWAWTYAGLLTAVALFAPMPLLREAARLGVILSGVVFFYITFRSGDRAAARRVMWFFEAALLVLIIGIVRLGIEATIAPDLTPDGRLLFRVVLLTLENLVLVGGILGAVFYVGAISPGLVVRKTVIYGVTVGSLIFAFATLQSVVADVLVDFLGVTDRLASAFMGTLFGLAFHPLRSRVEDLGRRFRPMETSPPPLPEVAPAPRRSPPDAASLSERGTGRKRR